MIPVRKLRRGLEVSAIGLGCMGFFEGRHDVGFPQRPWIAPIPGTTKIGRLEENVGAANVALTVDDLRQIDAAASALTIHGARYPEAMERMTGR